ncbi:hypothetical protein [Pseudomonas quasicaspiana]|uniref:hypothetical protein n=1 Tax=Pseudomonas quasicaspiana TaxID=2829821 RepID=UPI001E62D1DC|nr:hypothetical protein [Pseudomonas quasicaspiana]MCD5970437.1 hypothetical protein [Pseudomonas quasicaspiana]
MSWTPVTMRWPAEATSWMDDLKLVKDLAGSESAGTSARLAGLANVATTNPGPLVDAVKDVVAAGRAAMDGQLGEVPACITVTPFQSGVGQGVGNQRFLSAPNLRQVMADKFTDTTDQGRPTTPQYVLSILFLATSYGQLASTLSRFNALLPIPDLVRAERRAQHLSTLEDEKWVMPTAGPLPRWQSLPLERCTVLKASKQAMSGELAAMESYAADSSPLGDLAVMAARKLSKRESRDQMIEELKAMLANSREDVTMRAQLLGPGTPEELRKGLRQDDDDAPGHEWVLSSGVMLVGSLPGLSFVRELVGL